MPIEKEILQIEFPVSEVRDKAIRKIKQTTDAVTFTYHSLINYTPAEFLPLQTDSLPIVFGEVEAEMNTDSRKKDAINWIMRKAFEDFIIALTESLIEAYTFLKLRTFADKSKTHTALSLEQTEKTLSLIKDKSRKMSFPDLIHEIEKESSRELLLKKEILSINTVRNCLIHRNGIVSKLDTKNETDGVLRLHFIDLLAFYNKDNRMIEMKWANKSTLQTDNVQFGIASKVMEIQQGSDIKIDQNIVNAIAYTCSTFIEHLYATVVPAQK
jgi:hypothetical protein